MRETLAYYRHQARYRLVEVGSFFSLRVLREVVLTIGAVLGVVCLVGAVAGIVFGIRPIVFESGSMAPAIDTGALAISRTVQADDLAVGDVVTVPGADGTRVTHRIEQVTVANGTASLVLKGDANRTPDSQTYSVSSAPRVLFAVPKAGYVVSFLSGPAGVFGAGVLVGLVVLTVLRPGRRRSRGGGARRAQAPVAAGLILAVAAATSATAIRTSPTLAYYSDSASATSGTFTASTSSDQGHLCALRDGVLTFQWDPVPGATGYVLTLSLKGAAATVIHVNPGEIASIDLHDLSAGVYLVSLTAIGADPGVSVTTSLGTVVVLKVGNILTLGTALCLTLSLDLDLSLPSSHLTRSATTAAEGSTPTTSTPTTPETSDEPDEGTDDPSADPPTDPPIQSPADTGSNDDSPSSPAGTETGPTP